MPEQVKPDPAWMVPCQEQLSKLEGLTGAHVDRARAEDVSAYRECAARLKALQDFERSRGN